MSTQKEFLRTGKCGTCGAAHQVVVFIGQSGICGRCDPELFAQISAVQKERWLKTGKVFA
jgi:hypothetical protein